MKKPTMSTRQLKRKTGVNLQEMFSLYDQFKQEVQAVEQAAPHVPPAAKPVPVSQLLNALDLPKTNYNERDLGHVLQAKMKQLDQAMFAIKRPNEHLTFQKETCVKQSITLHITSYKEKQ